MATEVNEIDQIIVAMRAIKRDTAWIAGTARIAELAERVIELEAEIALVRNNWRTDVGQLNAARGTRDDLVEQLADMTKARDDYKKASMAWYTEPNNDAHRSVELSALKEIDKLRSERELAKLDRDDALNSVDAETGVNKNLREEIATLKQRAEDREQKFSRARNALTSSMLATDQVTKALGVLNE